MVSHYAIHFLIYDAFKMSRSVKAFWGGFSTVRRITIPMLINIKYDDRYTNTNVLAGVFNLLRCCLPLVKKKIVHIPARPNKRKTPAIPNAESRYFSLISSKNVYLKIVT